MHRFQENEPVRTTRTAGQILGHETLPPAVARMPLLGVILEAHHPEAPGEGEPRWLVRFDELGIEAVVAAGDLMPRDHHPASHTTP